MRRNTKDSGGLSALKLALIITGSIVAAAGIILIIAKLLKKKKAQNELEGCCCDCGCDEEWFDGDEDFLGDLRYDDDEDCCCGCESEDAISAAVDEAIEAIEAVTEE